MKLTGSEEKESKRENVPICIRDELRTQFRAEVFASLRLRARVWGETNLYKGIRWPWTLTLGRPIKPIVKTWSSSKSRSNNPIGPMDRPMLVNLSFRGNLGGWLFFLYFILVYICFIKIFSKMTYIYFYIRYIRCTKYKN